MPCLERRYDRTKSIIIPVAVVVEAAFVVVPVPTNAKTTTPVGLVSRVWTERVEY